MRGSFSNIRLPGVTPSCLLNTTLAGLPVEPNKSPVEDPKPYRDPIEQPPGDPQEDRPMRDPVQPDPDQPRS
jgi:hypothetical protein